MAALVRERTLEGLADCVQALGASAASVFRSAGLELSQIEESERWIPLIQVLQLFDAAAAETGTSCFGLRLASFRDHAHLGPIGLLVRHSPTAGAAMHDVAQYISAQNTGLEIELRTDGEHARIDFNLDTSLRAGAAQWIEDTLLSAVRFISEVTVDNQRPLEVRIQHDPLDTQHCYDSAFGVPIAFAAEGDSLLFDHAWLNSQINSPDRHTRRFVSTYLAQRKTGNGTNLTGTVAAHLDSLIPLGQANLDRVAAQMNIHPRTLQRRLKQDGSTFSALLEQRRKLLAEQLIGQIDLPLVHIAHFLGYADQSAFNHAFERWHGISPMRWRNGYHQQLSPNHNSPA